MAADQAQELAPAKKWGVVMTDNWTEDDDRRHVDWALYALALAAGVTAGLLMLAREVL